MYLSSTSYKLGARMAVTDVDDPELAEHAALLCEQGITTVRVATDSAVELAVASGAATLAVAGHRPPAAIVYAVDQPSGDGLADDSWALALGLGVPEVSVLTVGGSACANLGPALRVARHLVTAEGLDPVLIVTAWTDKGRGRYQPAGMTAGSDGAASLLASQSCTGPGFRVLGMATRTDATLTPAVSSLTAARATATAVRRMVGDLRAQIGASVHFDDALTANYSVTTRTFLRQSAGVGPESPLSAEIAADVGHSSAADLVVAMDRWTRAEPRRGGEKLLLLATSPRSWSAIAVEHQV